MQHLARACIGTLLLVVATLAAGSEPPSGETIPTGDLSRLPPVSASGQPLESPVLKSNAPFVTAERFERGYTIVVVGVNGDNSLSAGLAPGIVEGGYPGAVEVVDWTTGHWPLFLYHLRAGKRHRAGAQLIAEKINDYHTRYPGREVNLVGYSAGAVVAVAAVEMLADGQEIDRLVLLAGAISPLHDLRTVLGRTRVGVWSYYQPQDVVALWAGTLLAGTADGQHIMSAGAVGFWRPAGLSEQEHRLYRDKLVQYPYQPQMVLSGNLGGHFQCVGRKFVAQWISPVLTGEPNPNVAQSDVQERR